MVQPQLVDQHLPMNLFNQVMIICNIQMGACRSGDTACNDGINLHHHSQIAFDMSAAPTINGNLWWNTNTAAWSRRYCLHPCWLQEPYCQITIN